VSQAAAGSPPVGYQTAFSGLLAAIESPTYLTYKSLTSYDVDGCSDFCNATTGCVAFNIYFERDPEYTSCPLTSSEVDLSVTNVYCAIYSALPDGALYNTSYATNAGQWQDSGTFQVAITGNSDKYCFNISED
jgi:hypothetical protein